MARVDSLRMRAGQLFCACDSDGLPMDLNRLPKGAGLVRMASAFGISVFSQVLVLSVLPLASLEMVSEPARLAWPYLTFWPYLALLIGAAVAGFPASFLMDIFGRRAAFALGASLGIAGGILAAKAIIDRQFSMLVIGALWLGMAQGFALFYRHAGAIAGHAGGLVFGAGAAGALVAPFMVEALNRAAGPLTIAYALGMAGLANLVTLWLAVGLPARHVEIEIAAPIKRPAAVVFIASTVLAAFAWFGMTGLMARVPLMMVDCGLGVSMTASAMAVHLAAMYVPGFVIGRWINAWSGIFVGLCGVLLIVVGASAVFWQGTLAGFSLALALAGFGWGTATIGALAALHRDGRPSPAWLAMHDATLFIAALAGALAFGQLG